MNPSTNLKPETGRVRSIDIIRGVIMVLMAIDHVRVYSGIPAGGRTYDIFLTRWVTHFCAPGFAFLAGVSAFLYGVKHGKGPLSSYLLSRGLLLVILELTLIRFFWTFNFRYAEFTLAGIIWMLGWCMVILSALVRLKPMPVGIIGVAVLAGQQLFQYVPGLLPEGMRTGFGYFWEFIYPAGLRGAPGIAILYVLVPWIGVMAAGYGFGAVFLLEPEKRKKIFLWTGLGATALFLLIGSIIVLRSGSSTAPAGGQSGGWQPPFLMALLNQRKYPASQLYLLMTLGPTIACLPAAEKARGWIARVFEVFGRVPFFYYILHILLIHAGAILINYFRAGVMTNAWYGSAPFVEIAPPNRWSLPLLYLEWVIVVFILYFLCRWYANYKGSRPGQRWLRYL